MGGLPKRKGRSIVLRIYDSLGGKAKGRIEWDDKMFPVKYVWKCNALEDDMEDLSAGLGVVVRIGRNKKTEGQSINQDVDGHYEDYVGVDIELRAFEVATFRLQL